MKNFRKLALGVTIAAALLYGIAGCSGGGGGGGNDGDDGITYSGLTTQAELSQQNVEDISGGAFAAGLVGDGMMGFNSFDQSSHEYLAGKFRAVKVPQILSDSLHLIDFTASSPGAAHAALDTMEETVPGDCGGSLTYSVSADDAEGTFSGSFTFSQYCNDGTEINGSASFELVMDLETEEFIEAYLSFEKLTGGDLTFDGEIEIDFSASPDRITFNAYGQDPESGKVYWVRDYIITIEEGEDGIGKFVQIEISGMFYHPDFGYVVLLTTEPFVLYTENDNEWPTSGSLVVTGANNASAKLMASDDTNCNVELHLDEDDIPEWESGPISWDEL